MEAGVLDRRDYQRVTPMVDYTLTPLCTTLVHALMPLYAWGTEHEQQVTEVMRAAVDARLLEARAGENAVPLGKKLPGRA